MYLLFKVRELHLSLQTEKASRTDLEMYVDVINAQKTALAEETDRLRSQLKEGIVLFIYYLYGLG